MTTFAIDVAKWVEATKEKADLVVRKIATDILAEVVEKSPVGNPELWAANAEVVYRRETYNLFVDTLNSSTKPGEARARRKSQRTLNKEFPLKAGEGYVGGRFKGAWTVSIGTPAASPTDRVDPSGELATAAGASVIAGFNGGETIFISNSLPYAHRLEFDSWSKQAPAGMVRITVARFQSIASEAVAKVRA